MALPTGIRLRHSRSCPSWAGGACACRPSYEASAWSARDGKKVRKTFPTLAAARGWRADAQVGLRKGTLRAPTATTLRQAADAWLAGARDGSVRTRSGDAYKPSAVRSYEGSLRKRVLPELGAAKLSAITRVDLQDFADRLLAEGLDPSTIRNTLMPLRAIYRRALNRGEVAMNPTTGLELPAARGRRDRVADPEEARQLIAAVPPEDRAIWATALYAGLRRGELMALRWDDVDLEGRRIRVARSWDVEGGLFVAPKSAAGARVGADARGAADAPARAPAALGPRRGARVRRRRQDAVRVLVRRRAGEARVAGRGARRRSVSTSAGTPSPRC